MCDIRALPLPRKRPFTRFPRTVGHGQAHSGGLGRRTDVVVIGSGTGLAAALAAADAGAAVHLLEKTPIVGGTTAVSGGGFCAPNSRVVVDRSTPGLELVVEDGTVTDVVAERDGEEWLLGADAVVIAAGGLKWDEGIRD